MEVDDDELHAGEYKAKIREMFKLTSGGFERIIEFSPAWDKRSDVPGKNYGIHAVEIRFVLKGKKGAIQFLVGTDWYLPHNQKEIGGTIRGINSISERQPRGWDVGYHSPKPMYEGQVSMNEGCPYLDGKDCYYDGSGLRADEWVDKYLLKEGSDAVWRAMEREYVRVFGSE